MTRLTRLLVSVVIATYFGFFLLETVLWRVGLVNAFLLPQLNPGLTYPADAQVEIVRSLFANQGVYNLLLGLGGLIGLRLWKRGNIQGGEALLCFLCLFAVGAGATLVLTTHAYLIGAFQLIIPAVTLPRIRHESLGSRRSPWTMDRA